MPTVFITGGGGIIGPGLIHAFAEAGYDVAASYSRSKDRTQAALDKAHEAFGVKTKIVYGNNGKVEDIYAMFREVEETFGAIDVMINNAGLTFGTDFLNCTEEDFNHGVNIDFRGTFFCMQQAARNMIKYNRRGVIINVSSNHQTVTFQGAMLYAASKAAIDRMTKTASIELAPYGIRVVDIVPGYTEHEGFNERMQGDPGYEHIVGAIPLHKYATPSQIGKTALFLASDGAASITGTHIYVDGGAQNVTGVPG
ncbi:MAG: SDR family oxidoreductase [Clostridia bacterium]|nr:SDR family oxidoreductase [Clostridia bacterium]